MTQKKFQREIPKYGPYNLFYGKGPDGHLSGLQPFESAFLTPTDGKTIDTIKSPFYVEYFYRLKPDYNLAPSFGIREYYNYISKQDKLVITSDPPSSNFPFGSGDADFGPLSEFDKNFDRGIRLMFNLTAGIAIKKDPSGYFYAEPTDNLPFFKHKKDTKKTTYTDLYPLPFLSDYNLVDPGPNYAKYNYGKREGTSGGSFLSALWLAQQALNFGVKKKKNYLEGKFFNEYNSGVKDGKAVVSSKTNFYTQLAVSYYSSIFPQGTTPQIPTPANQKRFWPPALQWSKSLVSLEAADKVKIKDPCYAYFPMIIGELVDTTGIMNDTQLLEGLLKTETVTYLKSLVPKTSVGVASNEFLQKQLEFNNINLALLSSFGPDSTNPFNTKEEEKGLDNMLINLINFDEE